MNTRSEIPARLRQMPIVAVLRADRAQAYAPVVQVLIDEGVVSIESTLTTPDTLAHLPQLRELAAGRADIGIGTITSVEQADAAIAAGADYLVTPVTDVEIIKRAVAADVPVFPGAMTPTEVNAAWQAGATAVKLFPAGTVGASFGSHLRGPFPHLEFVPSGGIGLDEIEPWLRAGAAAVSLGSPLLGDALRGGSTDTLRERIRRTVAVVDQARVPR
ncbi:bifunctional 4-hydroxy-2-oxoglutarate aldolase/2-dehydro-3-deoxy-phosphogluconate aldolase [Microbacterium sp. NPDC076911]|uniref:bifunctional 4-hydroxy-2-oxoglutarate aldolase/2-dehydro-3-deoxy-phosphogluconate aldolase n=1 Tax=Microbacterium sp. NPDC076911 TaxID=3154958 RepID=UPI0034332422